MKRFFLLIFAVFLVLSCAKKESKSTSENKNKKVVLKLSTVFVDEEQTAKSLRWVAKNILDKSNGSLEIQVATGGSLPTGKDSVEQVVNGSKWISVDGVNFLGDYIPDFNAITGPMLYKSFDEYNAMVETDLVKSLVKKAEDEHGIKILALNYLFGFRSMLTEKPIKTPEDLAGQKIRVPNSQLYVYTLEAMGASPTPMPFPEVYSAIQQGVVDGLEASNLTIFGTKIYEVIKAVSLTRHLLGALAVSMSSKVFNSLSKKQQDILTEEFKKGADYNNTETTKLDKEYVDKLKKLGVSFNEVELSSFQERIATVFEKFPRWSPDIYDKIQEELAKIRGK